MEKKSQILFGKILRKTTGTTQGGLLKRFYSGQLTQFIDQSRKYH